MRTIKNALANLVQTAILNFKMAIKRARYQSKYTSNLWDNGGNIFSYLCARIENPPVRMPPPPCMEIVNKNQPYMIIM